MSGKLEILEGRIRTLIERLKVLHGENERLRGECETLKSEMAIASGESRKARRMLVEYDLMRRSREQAAQRVERALHNLKVLRVV